MTSQPSPPQADFTASPAGLAPLRSLVLFACLLLPWLTPRAGGPSTSVEPWLLGALCVALAFATQRSAALRPALGLALAAIAGWAMLRTGLVPETLALGAGCLLVFMAARLASGGSQDEPFLRIVALAWLSAAGVSTAIALVQYFGVAESLAPWVSASAAGEAFANLRQRNQFASLTVIGMASLIWLVPRELKPLPALAAMAWLAIGNAATTSRTGLAEMIALGLLACLWPGPRRQRITLWLVGLGAYALAAVTLPWLLEAVTGVPGNRLWERVASVEGCSSRTVLWSNVLHLVAQRPWLGWGWGELDFAHYATLYPGSRFCDILDNAHSLPLHLAVELGLPFATLVCGLLLWVTLRARPWSETDSVRQMAWGVLLILGVHSLLEYPLWYAPFQLAAGSCVGLLCAAPGSAAPRRQPAAAIRALVGFSAIVACGYAAWDYRRVSQIYLPAEARANDYRDDPMPKLRGSWLFRNQARFAELTITPLTLENQQWTFDTASALLHYSPEPRVIEKVIESGTLMGRTQEVVLHLARLRAAFPEAYAAWSQAQR